MKFSFTNKKFNFKQALRLFMKFSITNKKFNFKTNLKSYNKKSLMKKLFIFNLILQFFNKLRYLTKYSTISLLNLISIRNKNHATSKTLSISLQNLNKTYLLNNLHILCLLKAITILLKSMNFSTQIHSSFKILTKWVLS